MNEFNEALSSYSSEYLDMVKLSVHIITWNVACITPPYSINQLELVNLKTDLIIICIQEMDMSMDSIILNDTKYEPLWQHIIRKAIHPDYKKVDSVRMSGIFLVAYARKEIFKKIKQVMTYSVSTGLLGIMGNKGAVGLSLKLYDNRLCFISSHFAAHQEEVETRNQNFQTISSSMLFEDLEKGIKYGLPNHDVIFWAGDLNYRVDHLGQNDVVSLVSDGMLNRLIEYDQLLFQRKLFRVFHSYEEGPINFNPSYKYVKETSQYDLESKRIPSWCDRILWRKNNFNVEVITNEYNCIMDCSFSDHKPVYATFDIQLYEINKLKYQQVSIKMQNMIDDHHNKMMPSIKLFNNEINFGDVHFRKRICLTLGFTNDGPCRTRFEFVSNGDDSEPFPSWLLLDTHFGTLDVGESINICVTLKLEQKDVMSLKDSTILSHILIIRLAWGKDYYVCVDANYIPSCFGSRLAKLCNNPFPVKVQPECEQLIDVNNKQGTSIPPQLWRMAEFIYKYGITFCHIFVQSGNNEEINDIIDFLDYSNEPLENFQKKLSPLSVAEAYLLFLDMLPNPVILYSIQNQFKLLESSMSDLVFLLPNLNFRVLSAVILMIKSVLEHKEINKVDEDGLLALFGKVLMRIDYQGKNIRITRKLTVRYMKLILSSF